MTIVFTICSNNYLAQAISLGQSLILHNPEYKFVIGLVDRKISEIDYSTIPFDILTVESIGIDDFGGMIKRYDITELNTAVKPFYFRYFFENTHKSEAVIYLDPDIFVYSPFIELEDALKNSEIVVTPHFTTPFDDDKKQNEEDFLNSGLYNLGFIGIRNTTVGNEMVNWWAERLRFKSYINFKAGLFTDQIWINFVPLYFPKVHIFMHPGYNMAYWNLHERSIVVKDGNSFVNETYPLVFYHFSGFNPIKNSVLSKYQDRFSFENRLDITPLFNDYSSALFSNKYRELIGYKCYFNGIRDQVVLQNRLEYLKKMPAGKRIIRSLILRMIKTFKIDLDQ
jgi:hypothetical protein